MRTKPALAACLALSALVFAACGDSDSDSADSTVVSTDIGVEVSGEIGEKPTLTVPDDDPSPDLEVEVLSEGDGREVGENDVVVADYLGQTWAPRPPAEEAAPDDPADPSATPGASETAPADPGTAPNESATGTGTEEPAADAEPYIFDNSYDRGAAAGFSLNGVIPGWTEGLTGQTVGSRVLLSIPPDQGYGPSEGHDLQNDTLLFVVDIIDSIEPTASASGEPVADLPDGLPAVTDGEEGTAPIIDFAGATAPEQSDATLLVEGDGAEIGDNLVVNMVQATYPDGGEVITTWDEGQAPLTLASQQVAGIPGLAEALDGQSVGSRVLVRVSAADNPGAEGAEGTALVLLVDVIGSF